MIPFGDQIRRHHSNSVQVQIITTASVAENYMDTLEDWNYTIQ